MKHDIYFVHIKHFTNIDAIQLTSYFISNFVLFFPQKKYGFAEITEINLIHITLPLTLGSTNYHLPLPHTRTFCYLNCRMLSLGPGVWG